MTEHPMDPKALLDLMPFARGTGVEIDTVDPDRVVGRLPWAADRCTAGGVMHGGALVTLADSVAAVCAYLNLPRGASTSTIETKTNFFAAVRGGEVTAVAHPLHRGSTVIVVQTDLYTDGEGGDRRHVGRTTQTQAVLRKD